MSGPENRTFSIPSAQASYIASLVAAGGYASASEVVRAGLRALKEHDAIIEHWLREEAVPVYDEMMAHPERAIPAVKVFARIRAHYAKRMKKKPKT